MDKLIAEMFAVLDRIKARFPNWYSSDVSIEVSNRGSDGANMVRFGTWCCPTAKQRWFNSLEELESWAMSFDEAAEKKAMKQAEIQRLQSELAALEEKK